jgi:DNA-binding transcriptional ArsR family regulator
VGGGLSAGFPQKEEAAMAAEIVKLVPVRQKLQANTARRALDLLAGSEDLDLQPWQLVLLRRGLSRIAEPAANTSIWPGGFTMISREVTGAVWDWIRNLEAKDRPSEVRHAFDLVLTRDELAERMGIRSDKVSHAMRVLERGGIILAERVKIAGMRGPGVVTWRINPHLAWNGSLQARADAVKTAVPPLLKLMEGGKDAAEKEADR